MKEATIALLLCALGFVSAYTQSFGSIDNDKAAVETHVDDARGFTAQIDIDANLFQLTDTKFSDAKERYRRTDSFVINNYPFGGFNILDDTHVAFGYRGGVLLYQTLQAARNELGKDAVICLYEYNTGRYITKDGQPNGNVTVSMLDGAIDFSLQPWYNQYINESANGLPRGKYSPFGMDLSGHAYSSQNGEPLPSFSAISGCANKFRAAAVANTPYNTLYFYGLEKASNLLKEHFNDSQPKKTKEEYISEMSAIVFGMKCMLTTGGGDYRKDW